MSVNRLTIEQFKDYIYNHLPEYYREQDALVGKTLWKYLSIFDDGAFKFVIEDAKLLFYGQRKKHIGCLSFFA